MKDGLSVTVVLGWRRREKKVPKNFDPHRFRLPAKRPDAIKVGYVSNDNGNREESRRGQRSDPIAM